MSSKISYQKENKNENEKEIWNKNEIWKINIFIFISQNKSSSLSWKYRKILKKKMSSKINIENRRKYRINNHHEEILKISKKHRKISSLKTKNEMKKHRKSSHEKWRNKNIFAHIVCHRFMSSREEKRKYRQKAKAKRTYKNIEIMKKNEKWKAWKYRRNIVSENNMKNEKARRNIFLWAKMKNSAYRMKWRAAHLFPHAHAKKKIIFIVMNIVAREKWRSSGRK